MCHYLSRRWATNFSSIYVNLISYNTVVFIGILIKNKLPERPEKKEAEGDSKNILLEQVWPLIPKYSDLQKKKE